MLWTLALARSIAARPSGLTTSLCSKGSQHGCRQSGFICEIEGTLPHKTIPVVLRYLGFTDAEILRPTWVTFANSWWLLVCGAAFFIRYLDHGSEVVGEATFRCLIEAAETAL